MLPHVKVYVFVPVEFGVTRSLPEGGFVPDQWPEATQEGTPVDDQVMVDDSPRGMVVGFAEMVRVEVGARTKWFSIENPSGGVS